MPLIHANGVDLNYEIHGSGTATPLVMSHGFSGYLGQWKPALLQLAVTRPLILYDTRGHGDSSAPDDPDAYSVPIYAADLAALLDALGIPQAHVGGQSLGGMLSAQFAVDFPEKCASAILSDTTCGNGVDTGLGGDWERFVQKAISERGDNVKKLGMEEAFRVDYEWRAAHDPNWKDSPYTLDDFLRRARSTPAAGYIGAARAIVERPDLTARVPSITAPVLIMVGDRDGFYPCGLRDHTLIPGSRLVMRRGCAHGYRWRVDTWLAEAESFLADVDAGRPTAGKREV